MGLRSTDDEMKIDCAFAITVRNIPKNAKTPLLTMFGAEYDHISLRNRAAYSRAIYLR